MSSSGTRPDAVVSTYPLASLVLGRMRKKKWLRVPVATYLTDFAVHPLWVHPGIDLHLAVSPVSAETAAKRGGKTNVASGPARRRRVPRRACPTASDARRLLGIEPDERAVLVVAGSWGVGDVPTTVDVDHRAPATQYHPIIVCGKDEKLRESLLARGDGGTVLGWTDDMPVAHGGGRRARRERGRPLRDGGVRAGLPVISFQPIAGHGKDNAQVHGELGRQPLRARRRRARRRARGGDDARARRATTMIAARQSAVRRRPGRRRRRPRRARPRADALLVPFQTPRGRRRLALAAASLAGLYFGLTIGAHAVRRARRRRRQAAEGRRRHGVRRRARRRSRAPRRRRDRRGHRRPTSRWSSTGAPREHAGAPARALADAGVDIANGGWGKGRTLRWNRARDDCDKSWKVIAAHLGRARRTSSCPARALDAFDQIYCRTGEGKQRLVRPNETFRPEDVPDPEDAQGLPARRPGPRSGRGRGRARGPRAPAVGRRADDPPARGSALNTAAAVGAAAAGAVGVAGAVHAGPALAGVSPFGIRFTPALVGRGRRGPRRAHLRRRARPGVDAGVPRASSTASAGARRSSCSARWRAARRRSWPRSPPPATRSRCTATSTATCSGARRGAAADDIRRCRDTLAELDGRRAGVVPAAVRDPVVRRAARREARRAARPCCGRRGAATGARRRRPSRWSPTCCAATSTAARCCSTTPTASRTRARGGRRSARCRGSPTSSATRGLDGRPRRRARHPPRPTPALERSARMSDSVDRRSSSRSRRASRTRSRRCSSSGSRRSSRPSCRCGRGCCSRSSGGRCGCSAASPTCGAYVLEAASLAFGSIIVVQPLLVSGLLWALPLVDDRVAASA